MELFTAWQGGVPYTERDRQDIGDVSVKRLALGGTIRSRFLAS